MEQITLQPRKRSKSKRYSTDDQGVEADPCPVVRSELSDDFGDDVGVQSYVERGANGINAPRKSEKSVAMPPGLLWDDTSIEESA